ncbi:hypothetical protein KKI24_24460, partial [bacterium]|nr:hypothetical protein [bacterium]
MPDRGQWTEISVEEKLSTGAMPDGIAGRSCVIAEHATVTGINLLDATTDINYLFGDCELTADLEAAQANASTKFYCIVATYALAYLTKDNIQTVIQAILDMQYEPEFWVLHKPVDKDFADKFEEALAYFQTNKRWFSGIARFRKARVYDLEGVVAADGAGYTILPIVGHGFAENDQVVISGSVAYDGSHTVLASSTVDALHINAAFAEETFAAGALLE